MNKFMAEQDTASKPPEPRGEKTPDDEDGGADEDACKWDGSEAELVADETAELFEEQHTGIKLKFSLTANEIFRTLMKTKYTKTRIGMSLLAILLSAGMAVCILVQQYRSSNQNFTFLAVVCAAVVVLIGALPTCTMWVHSKKYADGHEIKMKIYPDHIEMGQVEKKWEIPLDGTTERAVFKDLIILYINSDNMVILPLRCVEPAVLPEVQAMILAGTQPI